MMIRLLAMLSCAVLMVGCTTVHLTVIVPPEADSVRVGEVIPPWVEVVPIPYGGPIDTRPYEGWSKVPIPWDSIFPYEGEWIIDTTRLEPDTSLNWIDL